jgi:hypothetical protein
VPLFVLLKFTSTYAVVIQLDLYSFLARFLLFWIALRNVWIGLGEYTGTGYFFASFD